jgi:hypothetical protein
MIRVCLQGDDRPYPGEVTRIAMQIVNSTNLLL